MSDTMPIESQLDELLTRGVGEFIDPDGTFKQKLLKKIKGDYKKEIIIKFGVDPTRPDIHIGHAVVFWKLRKLQEWGCKVIFLVGDFTSLIGDPTGKSKVRPEIDQQAIEANMKTYLDQVGKILIVKPAVFSWIRNSDWFTAVTDLQFMPGMVKIGDVNDSSKFIEVDTNSFVGKAALFDQTRMQVRDLGMKNNIVVLTLRTFLSTLRKITHSRLIARDMFQKRIEEGEELYMHEMMYPVLQGIDSAAIHSIYGSCDLEVGGTDQTFNMLMGRDVMKSNNQEQQAVLAFKLLEGLDGKEKMSKSLDNYIAITDQPNDMYGKVMSIPDTSIVNFFELATFTLFDRIAEIKKDLEKGSVNPKDHKMELARQIVALYHGEENAKKAEENFISTFKKGGIPDDVEKVEVNKGSLLSDVLLEKKVIASKTEWKRLVEENAVLNMNTEVKVTDQFIKVEEDAVYKIGKRRFIKITIK